MYCCYSSNCAQTDNETRALCRQLVQSGKLAAVQKALNNRIGSSYSGACWVVVCEVCECWADGLWVLASAGVACRQLDS